MVSSLPPDFKLEPVEPLGVADSVALAFARFVMQWSYAEQAQSYLLAYLVHAEPALFQVIANDVSAASVAGWLRAIGNLRLREIFTHERFTQLLDDTGDLRAYRNRLIHGMWKSRDTDSATVVTVKPDRNEVFVETLVTPGDLNHAAQEAARIAGEFSFLCRKVAEANAASHP